MEAGVNPKLVPVGVGRNLRLMLLSVVTRQTQRTRGKFFEPIKERTRRDAEYREDIEALVWLMRQHKVDYRDLNVLLPLDLHDTETH